MMITADNNAEDPVSKSYVELEEIFIELPLLKRAKQLTSSGVGTVTRVDATYRELRIHFSVTKRELFPSVGTLSSAATSRS